MITDIDKRNALRKKSGLPSIKRPGGPLTMAYLYQTQWSFEFEKLMRNRLAMGYFRYGPLHKQKKGQYDCIGSIEKRIALYKESGNDEILVDVANLCLVEFILGIHPLKHFSSVDDGIHAEKVK